MLVKVVLLYCYLYKASSHQSITYFLNYRGIFVITIKSKLLINSSV